MFHNYEDTIMSVSMDVTSQRSRMSKAESNVRNLFEKAGITINGSNPGDIQIHDNKFYHLFDEYMSLGYMQAELQGMISVDHADVTFHKLFNIGWQNTRPTLGLLKDIISHKYLNLNKLRTSYIADIQYNLPTPIFTYMLSKDGNGTGSYTCGYWRDRETGEDLDGTNPANLEAAQIAKHTLLCDKLGLKPGMHVLDMGCGWGNATKFMAENYGVKVTAVTIAEEQVKFGRELCKGLDVEFLCQSYTDPIVDKNGNEVKFDAIFNLGMFEHVGNKNHKTFFNQMEKFGSSTAKIAMQTISFAKPVIITDAFIERCIFPDMTCSSPAQVASASEANGYWRMMDLHELTFKNGHSMYDPTLMAWHFNFNKNWDEFIKSSITPEVLKKFELTVGIKNLVVEDFRKIWNFYLLICAGAYRSGNYPRLIQYVFNPPLAGLTPEVR
jgi:cyclopropane-fatty-acyl-phospholipid synthase